MAEPLPPSVQAFLDSHIDSLVALDALLVLRSEPEPWPLAEVARRLGVVGAVARGALADLQARGLVSEIGAGWLVAELPGETTAVIATLEQLHRRDRWQVARHVAGHFLARLRVMTTAFTREAP
jgi:DNA-binding IclR family transcriptional regulator